MPDIKILAKVCGANDSNVRLIERHLGAPVFIEGNEISLASEDSQKREQFRFIFDRLVDEAEDGFDCGGDLVLSVLNAGQEFGRGLLEDLSVVVPGSERKVYPKTAGQARLVRALREGSVVFAEGPAGCGKTLLAVAEALRLLLSKEKRFLVLTRPVVEAGESLGFLPGALEDKINPYLRPLFDAVNFILPREGARRLLESGAVEIAPLAYMRGRTLSDAVVILDEAQNATREQMKMFLTRMGENSKIFVTGDTSQIDLPKRFASGLGHAMKILSGIPEIRVVRLDGDDVVRSGLARQIVRAYEDEKQVCKEQDGKDCY